MATSNTPFGLKYVSGDIQLILVDITASTATAIYKGDCVCVVTAGTYARHTVGSTGISGVAWAFERSDGTMVSYVPASDTTYNYKAIINICPDTLYVCQEDGDTTALTLLDMGNTAHLVYTHAGSTTTGISGMEIDSDTKGTTAGHDVVLIQLADWLEPDGTATAFGTLANAKFLVKVHNMVHGQLGTGI